MKYTEFNYHPYEAHMIALNLVPPGSRVLDLGCATGYFAKELKKKECSVVGVDNNVQAIKLARRFADETYIADLEKPNNLPIKNSSFDRVLLLDVIEHIGQRQALLEFSRRMLKPNGRVIISTPNIAHISVRLKILFGDFTYSRIGIMDESHVHFFTKKTLKELLKRSGLIIENMIPSSDFGQLPVVGRFMRYVPKDTQATITTLYPTLLGIQFVALCKKNDK